MFGGHGHGMICRRKKHARNKDIKKRMVLARSRNAILHRLKNLENDREEENVTLGHDIPMTLPPTVENVIKEIQGKLTEPTPHQGYSHRHRKHQFIPLNIPLEVSYGNSHDVGLHDMAFIQRANLSSESNSQNAQAAEGLGQALSMSNSSAAAIARAVLEREDATRNVREKADDKMAAKFGASFDAMDVRPPAEKILQDRVDQGMVMLMLQQNHRKSGPANNHIFHGPKIKMTSDSMMANLIENAEINALKIHKPSPRSQKMLENYCRGTYTEPNPEKEDDDIDDTEGILNKNLNKYNEDNYPIDTESYFRRYAKIQRKHFQRQMKGSRHEYNENDSRTGSRSGTHSKPGSSTRSSSRVTNIAASK